MWWWLTTSFHVILRWEVQLSLILLYFWGHKSHLWRLVVLRNHQQMAAMHQKPVLGFSRLARQHKREAPLMMRAKRVSTDDTLYHPSDFIPPNTCSHFASDRMEEVGPQTIEPERGTPHLFFFLLPTPTWDRRGPHPPSLHLIRRRTKTVCWGSSRLGCAAVERINIKTTTGRGVRLHLTVRREHKLLHHEQTSSCMLSQTLH